VTGDGVLIRDPEKPENDRGFALNFPPRKTAGGFTLPLPGPVAEGAPVYITSSRDLDARARRIIGKPGPDLLRPLPVSLEVTVQADGSFLIEGLVTPRYGVPVPVSFHSRQRMQPARTHPLGREQLEQQLKKTGGTPFTVSHTGLRYDGTMFAPVAVLNEVRREFFRLAGERLVAASRPRPEDAEQVRQRLHTLRETMPIAPPARHHTAPAKLRLSVYTDSLEGVRGAALAGADTCCFEPGIPSPRHLCTGDRPLPPLRTQILAAMDTCRDAGVRLVWKFPRIAHDCELDALVPEAVFLHRNGLTGCMVENPGTARALAGAAPSLSLLGSIGLNVFNHAAAMRAGIPFELLTVSPELSGTEIRELTGLAAARGSAPVFSLIVQGTSEAMITEDCIPRLALPCREKGKETGGRPLPGFLGLRDGTGRIFPLVSDGNCRTLIGNAFELCLIDHLPAIRDAGITDIAVDARHRPPLYTGRMVALYRRAMELSGTGRSRGAALRAVKSEAGEIASGGITAGHFLRGL